MSSECYIEPGFVKPKNNKKLSHYKDEVKEVPTSQGGSIIDTIKKNKVIVIVFAVVIILLICLIVWFSLKSEKAPIVQNKINPKESPPQVEKLTPPTTPVTTPAAPTTSVAPTIPTQTPEKKPEEPEVFNHEQIIATVDDEELQKYIQKEDEDD